MNINETHLPRQVEQSDTYQQIVSALSATTRHLWDEHTLAVPEINLSEHMKQTLITARRTGRVLQGLEAAGEQLRREEQGLKKLKAQQGPDHTERVSRLMLVSNDGTKWFYKDIDKICRRYAPRLLCCRLRSNSREIGGLLFGKNSMAKCILIDHKDAVSQVLLSLVP